MLRRETLKPQDYTSSAQPVVELLFLHCTTVANSQAAPAGSGGPYASIWYFVPIFCRSGILQNLTSKREIPDCTSLLLYNHWKLFRFACMSTLGPLGWIGSLLTGVVGLRPLLLTTRSESRNRACTGLLVPTNISKLARLASCPSCGGLDACVRQLLLDYRQTWCRVCLETHCPLSLAATLYTPSSRLLRGARRTSTTP